MPRHTPIYSRLHDRERLLPSDPELLRKPPTRLIRWILLLALLALLLFGIQNAYSALADSDLFRLEQISVVGNQLLTDQQVIARSGLQAGVNLFAADLEVATQRLTADPLIRETLLLRQPPGRLVISLTERRPVALVAAPEGLCALDPNGSLFSLPQAPVDLPVITGIKTCADSSGIYHFSRLVMFLEQLQTEAPAFLADISEIHLVSPAEARVYLVGDGMEIRMRFENAAHQARNFEAFLNTGAHRVGSLAYIDLRFADQVIVGTD